MPVSQKWYSEVVENIQTSERGVFSDRLRGRSLDHPVQSHYMTTALDGPVKSDWL